MELIAALIWLVYYDAASFGLELEVADAVKFYFDGYCRWWRCVRWTNMSRHVGDVPSWKPICQICSDLLDFRFSPQDTP